MVGLVATSVMCASMAAVAFVLCFYLYVKMVYRYFEKRGIPYDNPTFPFGSFASLAQLRKPYHDILVDMYNKYKSHKMVGFFSLWKKEILITDPEILKSILIRDFNVFHDRGVYSNKLEDPLSANLFALHGDVWRSTRNKVTPTFSSGKIKGMLSIIVQCANQVVRYVDMLNDQIVEFQPLFSRYGLAVISNGAFSLDCDVLKTRDSMFVKMAGETFAPTLERLVSTFIRFNNNGFAKHLKMRIMPQSVCDFFMDMFTNAVKHREVTGEIRSDYLQLLIQLRQSGLKAQNNEVEFTEMELVTEAFVFILAGSETTSRAMSFCLYELAQNPEIQEKVRAEVDSLTEMNYETLNKLEYLEMVIDETLRKYPPLPFLNRECNSDYKVPETGFTIEKGTQVLVSTRGLHNDPDLYPEPEKFIPERFSKENRMNIKPCTYMPFGEGQRACIGQRFAKVVMKVGISTFLRNYEIHSTPVTPYPVQFEPKNMLTTELGSCRLRVEKRGQFRFFS
uniref:Cytochrome P450 n=1 Tax=Homalodisca liturata TaxID=320908 RepID=A0A1B6IGB6_9HEMI